MFDRNFKGFVEVSQLSQRGMITLRGEFDARKVQAALKKAIGVDLPERGKCVVSGDRCAAWMSPDEVLIMLPHADVTATLAAVTKATKGAHFLAVDVSDARAGFVLAGKGVRDLLAKVVPIDLHASALKTGDFRRTTLAQVAGALWVKDADHIEIVCFRSVQDYVWALLCNAAKEGSAPAVLI